MTKYIDDIHPEYSFATAYDREGAVHDYIGNYDTAITLANEGYRVVVHQGDEARSVEQYQESVDRELANAIDCFGDAHRK
jgi:hypothetical protein